MRNLATDLIALRPDWLDERLLALIARPIENSEEAKRTFIELLAQPSLQGDALLADLPKLLRFHTTCAMHDGALASMISIHYNLCMGSIKSMGNDSDYVRSLYKQLNEGTAIGVYLATELGYGSNLFSLETEARYCPERQIFVLDSPSRQSYKFMPNSTHSPLPKIAVVMARLMVNDKFIGILPFLVPLHAGDTAFPGVRITALGHKPGMHLDNAMTSFENVELPYEALLQRGTIELDRDGQLRTLATTRSQRFMRSIERVQSGKLCMASCALAVAMAGLHINYTYAQKRQTFSPGGPVNLLAHPTYRHPLAIDVVTNLVHAAWLEQIVAGHGKDALKPLAPDVLNEVAILKAVSTWASQDILVRCRERCGAQGMFAANKIIGYLLNNNGAITAEGENLVIMLKAAAYFMKHAAPASAHAVKGKKRQRLLEHLDTCIDLIRSGIADKRDRFLQSEDMLLLAKLLGVRMASVRYLAHIDESPLDGVILDVFLLSQLEQHAVALVRTQAASSRQIRSWANRKQALLVQHAPLILERLKRMDMRMLEVPISSDSYIEHYASRHHDGQAA
jgi:acyl-CoA oxidase